MGLGIGRTITRLRYSVLTTVSRRHRLNGRGKGMLNFIDVGSLGPLPAPWFSNQDRIGFLLNFEPHEAPRRTANSLTLDTALWEGDAERPFYVYKGFSASGSSLFEQNTDYVRDNFDTLRLRGPRDLAESWLDRSTLVKTATLRCRALDEVLQQSVPDVPFHFMKIDTQGAELNILRGAEQLLRTQCIGLHLELFTLPLYKGIALLPEVQAHCAERGFRLVKKSPAHGSFDSQHDCLFLRENADPALLAQVRQVYVL